MLRGALFLLSEALLRNVVDWLASLVSSLHLLLLHLRRLPKLEGPRLERLQLESHLH